MNIWVIGRGIPTKTNRMLGQFELGQAQMLSKEHSVSYIAQGFSCHMNFVTPKMRFECYDEGDVKGFGRTVPYLPDRLGIHSKLYFKSRWRGFLRKVEKCTGIPDIIHIHYPTMICDPDAILFYKSKGVKIVCTEHWGKVLENKIDLYQREQLKKFVEISDTFICVGRPLKESVMNIAGNKGNVVVVPNIVSDQFKWNGQNKGDGSFTYVAIGRIVPGKQFDQIVKGFSMAFSPEEDVFLKIIGSGRDYEQLADEVSRNPMKDRIALLGTLTREEVALEVEKSNCLICYSQSETFGVPVIEGWACGLPVIVSDCIGFKEYWNDDLGIMISSTNLSGLVDAMKRIRNNYSSYDNERISSFAIDHFGEDTIRRRLTEIYCE